MQSSHVSAKFRDEITSEPREPKNLWERIKSPFILATPLAATSTEWEEWRQWATKNHPILHWFHWDFTTGFKRTKRRFIEEPIDWVRYRTVSRYHHLHIASLTPGYRECDTRMLHANFQLLVDHVEIHTPCRHFTWFEENKVKHRSGHRYPHAGLAHLDWEIGEPDCYHGTPGETQGDHARIKKELYLWWKFERPARMEPWSADPIWGKIDRDPTESFDSLMNNRNPDREKAGEQAGALDEIQEQEDQLMLARLVHIRRSLWT